MSALQELRDAINHVTACTGDRDAWQRGLAPGDVATVTAAAIDPAAVTGLLAKVRANHPALFDARTGVPVTSGGARPEPPTDQQGEAVTAMKKAEEDLAQQNSLTAQLDLHVIGAILNAHTEAVDGSGQLRRLQQEVQSAVRSRTDLDTPSGARDFQRYLIGKMREIGAVVESANLDDTSKAALASAWTALYKTSAGGDVPDAQATSPAGASSPAVPAPQPDTLPPYGSDLDSDPLLDSLLGSGQTVPAGVDSAPAPPPPTTAPPMPAQSGSPFMPMSPFAGGLPAPPLGGAAELTKPDLAAAPVRSRLPDDALEGLFDEYPLDEMGDDPAEEAAADEHQEDTAAPEVNPIGESTTVRLPDGSHVDAPTAKIADVLRSAIAGTPVVDAFRAEGISVPPPGTAVAHPVDQGAVVGGDVGMLMDRQALAVDRERALLDGRIQPVASVSGPSFLGWLHPDLHGATTPAPESTPMQGGAPPPTRPASAGAR